MISIPSLASRRISLLAMIRYSSRSLYDSGSSKWPFSRKETELAEYLNRNQKEHQARSVVAFAAAVFAHAAVPNYSVAVAVAVATTICRFDPLAGLRRSAEPKWAKMVGKSTVRMCPYYTGEASLCCTRT